MGASTCLCADLPRSILPVNVEVLHAVTPFPVRLAVPGAGFLVARVDGNGLSGKRGRRIGFLRCFCTDRMGPHRLSSTTEFGEQLFVTRRAEADKRPFAQPNSLFGRVKQNPSFSFHSVSGVNLWNY